MGRGLLRLALALVLLWMVYWTVAYVIHSQSSENGAFPPAFTQFTLIVIGVAAVLLAPWVVLGFRR